MNKLQELRISITSRCNMDCVYCHNEGNLKCGCDMSNEILYKICEESKKNGITKIRLTGGDPLVVSDIEEKCKYISQILGQEVSLNTNAVENDILLELVKKKYVKSVVVGLDYYDGIISKMSTRGKSSKEILETILKIKNYGCNVSVDLVYDGDINNVMQLAQWAYNNEIRLKIIEKVDKSSVGNNKEYKDMMQVVMRNIELKYYVDDREEVNGFKKGMCIISFFESLCRNKRCDICSAIQMRVTPEGIIRRCIWNDDKMIDLKKQGIEQGIVRALKNSEGVI